MRDSITANTLTCWSCGAPIRMPHPNTTNPGDSIVRNLDGTPHHCSPYSATPEHEAHLQELIILLLGLPLWCTDAARHYVETLRQRKHQRVANQTELYDEEWWGAE